MCLRVGHHTGNCLNNHPPPPKKISRYRINSAVGDRDWIIF